MTHRDHIHSFTMRMSRRYILSLSGLFRTTMKIWRAPSGMKVGGGYGSNESDVIAAFHVDMFEMD